MSHYSSLKTDYRNSARVSSGITTINSIDSSISYKMKVTFIAVPQDVEKGHYYINPVQVSNYNITNDDYGYFFPMSRLYCIIQFLDSSNSPVKYLNSNVKINVRVGNSDKYTYCWDNKYSNNYKNETSYPNSILMDFGWKYHNPTSGSRGSESTRIELVSSVANGLNGYTTSTTVYYNTIVVPSLPTVNHHSILIPYTSGSSYADDLIINMNRVGSSVTHDIYVTVMGSEYCELYRGNGDTYYVDNYKLASNVSTSYTWTNSSMRSLLINAIDNVSRKVPCYIKVNTKYNGQIVGTTYVCVIMYIQNHDFALYRYKLSTGKTFQNQPFFGGYTYGKPTASGVIWNSTNGSYKIESAHMKLDGDESSESINSSSSSYSFSVAHSWNTVPNYREHVMNNSRYLPIKYVRGSLWGKRSDGKTSTHSISYTISEYSNPYLNYINIYKVDANDNRDEEGNYWHISFDSYISSTEHGAYESNWEVYNMTPMYNNNYQTVTMKYKKSTESSWNSTTLYSTCYDTNCDYDRRYTGNTFDPTYIYNIEITITDAFGNSRTYSKTVSPSDVLIDYNESGHSLSFGMPSQAANSDRILETNLPIYFTTDTSHGEYMTNLCEFYQLPYHGIINQRSGNTSKYTCIFSQQRTTDYYGSDEMYSIVTKDTDTFNNAEFRFNTKWSYFMMTPTKFRINANTQYTNTGGDLYYCDIAPGNTYMNFYTNASYYYFDKEIRVNGDTLATQNYVSTYVNNNAAKVVGNLSSWGGVINSGNHYGCGIGDSTNGKLQFCVGYDSVSISGKGVFTKSISFSTSFGSTPAVVAVPCLSYKDGSGNSYPDWKCELSVTNVNGSSFNIAAACSGWNGTLYFEWIAIGKW